MTTKQDILDEELDDVTPDEEGEEGGEGGEAKKPEPAQLDATTVTDLKQAVLGLQRMVANAGGATKQQEAKVAKTTAAFEALIKNGYKPEQLEALAIVVEAMKEDLREEYATSTTVDKSKTFDKEMWDRTYEEVDKAAEKIPGLNWARDEIVKRTSALMASHPDFERAREAYKAQRSPSRSDFEKAVRMVSEIYIKESGMKQPDRSGTNQLDTKSSRTRSTPAISKDGKTVDVTKLTSEERDTYEQTLNITKNKDLALKALKTLHGY